MANLALAFDILARDKGATKTFKEVGAAAETAGKQGEGFGANLKKGLGVAAGAIAAAGIGTMLKDVVTGASDLSETINKSNVIFGKNADEVKAWSKTAATSFGLSQEAALGAAANFGNMLQQLGYTGDAALEASTGTVQLAADLGSFNNLGTEDVLDRIGAAMRGEYDSLQLLIPNINAARVEQEALAMTGKDAAKELTAQEKAAATLAIVQRDGAAAAGDFAETNDGLANRTKIARAQFEDLKDQIGQSLLPVFEALMGFVSKTVLPGLETMGEYASQVFDILFRGDFTGGPLAEDSAFVDRLFDIRDGFLLVKDVAGQAFDVLFRGDFTGGPLSEDSVAVDRLFALRDAFLAVRDFVRDEMIPRIGDLAAWWDDKAMPALTTVRDFLRDEFQPSWEELVTVYNEDVKPGLDDLREAFERNKPELMAIAGLVGSFVLGMLIMEAKIRSTILPVLFDLAGMFGGFLLTEIGKTLDKIGFVVDKAGEMKDAFVEFMEAVREFKLPGWITGVAGASAGVAAAIKGAATGILGAVGDGPGKYGGGNTLNRVKGILPAGAQITSTYRTPAQNRAVGGVTGSYHTDRGNPAVDIAGSRAAMDQVYARLAAMGGWRELLYKTKGHWDHVHVAHNGGTVSANWPTMPGWGANERPVRAQVGEQIIPAGAAGTSKTYNVNVTNQGRPLGSADVLHAIRATEVLAGDW